MRDIVAFRMNPGGIERLVAANDAKESGGLRKRRFADAGHLEQFTSRPKAAMFVAPGNDAFRAELIEARHVLQ